MKTSINKSKISAIAIVTMLLLMAFVTLWAIPISPVEAQLEGQVSGELPAGVTANYTVAVKPYLSFRPIPVGLNQAFLINMWTSPGPSANRLWKDFKLTITKPDGTKDVITMNSYLNDGTAWLEYVADQLGEWKLKFEFPGNYFPTLSLYAKPASTPEQTLIVQEAMVASWPESPLPTDYWTRPVAYENREWWPILGGYPWYGPGQGSMYDKLYPETNHYYISQQYFTPWVQAPNSAHVVWKNLEKMGGLLGADQGTRTQDASITDNTNQGTYPNVIQAGRAYQAYTKPGSGKTAVTYWKCYDIRTGELYWERPLETGESAPTIIEYGLAGVGGGGGDPEQVAVIRLISISNGYLRKYNLYTGAMVTNVTIPLTGSGGTYYMNGYVLGIQNLGTTANPNYRLINWTTFGTSSSNASRIMSNTTYARSSLPTYQDWEVGLGATVSTLSTQAVYSGVTVLGFNLYTGAQLWNQTISGVTQYSGSCNIADHGKIAVLTEQGNMMAWDLATGTLAWKSAPFDYPWDEPGFGGYGIASAYGLLYRNAYTGVYAFNWTDGSLAWKYKAIAWAQTETPYIDENGQTVYSWNIDAHIADGKYFVYNTEHSATNPITRGWEMHAINATSGEKIWSVAIPGASSKHQDDIGAIADGYLTLFSSDGYMYVFGKGKSQMTVTSPDVVTTKGNGVVIKGTVLDISPAQASTPCVSKESMALQMEYIHKQMPITGIWGNETIVGVPVSIDAVDPNGNYIHIGEVTTDGYSGTFGYTWTPELEGMYTVTASFKGDDSYGSSFATTYVSVTQAPVASATPTASPPITMPPYEMYTVGTGIAVIIVVVIATLLLLKKRP